MVGLRQIHHSVIIALLVSLLTGGQAIAQSSRKIQQIFRFDMLDVQVPYLETIAGPARRISPPYRGGFERREYRVDGCEIWALVRGSVVRAYGIRLTRNCTFSYRAMVPNAPAIQANTLTFGQLGGHFEPACWLLCGNAVDPSYATLVQYSRADGSVEARGTVAYPASVGNAPDVVLAWARRMLPESDVIDVGRVADLPGYQAQTHQAFRNVRISEIEVGYLTQ